MYGGIPQVMASNSKMDAEEKKWRADSDLRTLIEAEKIKGDKARYGEAMKLQKEMKQNLEAIAEGK